MPTSLPSTQIPSPLPTITGEIASVTLSGFMTADMSPDDITSISSDLAEIYGVDVEDIETTVEYLISGALNVTISEDISPSELINSLKDAISETLGVHSSDVIITVGENEEVIYSVVGGSYEEVEQIRNLTSDTNFMSNIIDKLDENDSGIILLSATSNDEAEGILSITIDTTQATRVDDADIAISILAEQYDFTESIVEGTLIQNSTL